MAWRLGFLPNLLVAVQVAAAPGQDRAQVWDQGLAVVPVPEERTAQRGVLAETRRDQARVLELRQRA